MTGVARATVIQTRPDPSTTARSLSGTACSITPAGESGTLDREF